MFSIRVVAGAFGGTIYGFGAGVIAGTAMGHIGPVIALPIGLILVGLTIFVVAFWQTLDRERAP